MGKISKFLGMFDKLDDIIYEPIKTISDWSKEPLKKFEAGRQQKAADAATMREIIKKQMLDELNNVKSRMDADLEVLKANQIIDRNKKILDTITEYRRAMIEDAKDIANSLSHMEINLLEDANNLVIEKTNEYKKIQQEAQDDCDRRLMEIQEKYADNERVRIRREDQVMNQCDDMVKQAQNFISQLKDDIKRINDNNSVRVGEATNLTDKIMIQMGSQIGGQVHNIAQEQIANQSSDYIETSNSEIIKN